jgi:hypothetical protein
VLNFEVIGLWVMNWDVSEMSLVPGGKLALELIGLKVEYCWFVPVMRLDPVVCKLALELIGLRLDPFEVK